MTLTTAYDLVMVALMIVGSVFAYYQTKADARSEARRDEYQARVRANIYRHLAWLHIKP